MADTPLTCYICGETEPRVTVDMIGCLKDQEKADERFKEKFGEYANGYIDICPKCKKNISKKYLKNI